MKSKFVSGEEIVETTQNLKIDPGFYSFRDLSKILKREVAGINISLKITRLIDLTVPANVDLWLTDTVKYMIGLDNDDELSGWPRDEYGGDRPVEFLPAGGISIYLNEVSKNNL